LVNTIRAWSGVLAVLVLSAAVRADVAPPPPLAERVARSPCVVVGKVVRVEDRTVEARSPYGDNRMTYQVAVVQITDAVSGAGGLTHVRVGCNAVPNPRRTPHLPLKVGQEGLFYLTPHADETFFVMPNYFDMTQKLDKEGFEREVAEAKRLARLLADPDAGLTSKDAAERYQTARMLILRYRGQPWFTGGKPPKEEPIDARQSKLILKALAEADWNRPEGDEALPLSVFVRLGLTEADGWKTPPDLAQGNAAAQKWLKANAETYRIRRLVAEKPGR
jgi:hypothetical protein